MTSRAQLPAPVIVNGAVTNSPQTVGGIQYVWEVDNSGSDPHGGHWKTVIGKNIVIVTKDTDANYTISSSETQSVTHKPNEELLEVSEIDSNFIQLKQGILDIEREANYFADRFDDQITALQSGQLQQATDLTSAIGGVMPKTGGTFSGEVLSNFDPGLNHSANRLITGAWFQRELGALTNHLVPSINNNISLGSSTKQWKNAYFSGNVEFRSNILPDSTLDPDPSLQVVEDDGTIVNHKNVNIGSSTNRFNEIFAHTGNFAKGTVNIGSASISQASSGGLLLPANSAVGTEGNVIPSSFANTVIDERYAQTATAKDILLGSFTSAGTITQYDAVKLSLSGQVSSINSVTTSDAFIGFATNSAISGDTVGVIVSGRVPGFSGLTAGDLVYLKSDGTITQTDTTAEKIGRARSSTELYLFSRSEITDYVLTKTKAGLGDFSVVASPPSGQGSLLYSNTTGQFSFVPPDLTGFATETFVTAQINNLIDGAPAFLDTLNELAEAVGDNANFATTITNALALKAPLVSPALTGSPTAPTPASSSDDTSIATTAFVKSQAGAQNIGALTNVTISDIRNGQVLAYNSSTGDFRNQNQSGIGGSGGGAGTIDFVVDGGTATNVSSQTIIVLDGGTA